MTVEGAGTLGYVWRDDGDGGQTAVDTNTLEPPPTAPRPDSSNGEGEDETGHHAGWGDYADTGSLEPDGTIDIGDAATLQVAGAPIDYGDTNDPGASEAPSVHTFPIAPGVEPGVVDPVAPGEGSDETAGVAGIELDMAGSLYDGGNPLDPSIDQGIVVHVPDSGETEYGADNDFAFDEPGMEATDSDAYGSSGPGGGDPGGDIDT